MDRFEECRAAQDGRACTEQGGEWAQVGLKEDFTCVCPTGQRDCPCTRSTDCLGTCTAPMNGMNLASCENLNRGTCTPSWPVRGCRCWFSPDGSVMGACVD
jgi:hypothetical protein